MSTAPVATTVAQPFLAAVTETFAGLLGLEAVGNPIAEVSGDDLGVRDAVTALIEFDGPRYGIVLVSFPKEVAHAVVERLLKDAGGVEDGDVADGVGELANIVAGRAKAVLSAIGLAKLDMSVPTVVTGFSIADLGLENADWCRIDFATEVGLFSLRVAFDREPSRVLTVLLADDSKVMRKIERAALLEIGQIEFLEASNGAELVDRFLEREGKLDLVVLDVKMPEVDGYEGLRRLRADPRGKTVPVVIVSSLPRAETEPRVRLASPEGTGPVAFVGKPFDGRVLAGTVKELLAGQRPEGGAP